MGRLCLGATRLARRQGASSLFASAFFAEGQVSTIGDAASRSRMGRLQVSASAADGSARIDNWRRSVTIEDGQVASRRSSRGWVGCVWERLVSRELPFRVGSFRGRARNRGWLGQWEQLVSRKPARSIQSSLVIGSFRRRARIDNRRHIVTIEHR
eukprot:631410-Prorocentrum_minimum.AAC.3